MDRAMSPGDDRRPIPQESIDNYRGAVTEATEVKERSGVAQ